MKKRKESIDLLKGILTISMIIAHIIQFFPINIITKFISNYINLTTFSGFMFAFGYTSYKKEKHKFNKKQLKKFAKILIIYYISSIFYTILISKNINTKVLLQILLLQKIVKYNEFLLSFAFLYLIKILLNNKLNNLNNKNIIFLIILSLLSKNINYNYIKSPLIGIFIGTTSFYCFPIIQYSSYFLIGKYLEKNKIIFNKTIYLLSLFRTLTFIIYYIINLKLPSRFPPSIYWIIGGAYFIYIYYITLEKIKPNFISTIIKKIGTNTLSYLLYSNIVIFFTHYIIHKYNIHYNNNILYLLLLFLCISIPYTLNNIKK